LASVSLEVTACVDPVHQRAAANTQVKEATGMAVQASAELGDAAKGGLIAGVVAGIVSSIFATAISLVRGQDIWVGAKTAAYPFVGDRVLQPGFDLVLSLVGVLIHFAVSIGWGISFAIFCYGLSSGATVIAGVAWGLVVWIAMFDVVLPLAGAAKVAHMTPVGRAIVEHVIFGLSVAIGFLPFQRARNRAAPQVK
jgi:hypothetical protein